MRKCNVCAHPQREAIDRDLVAGKSFRNVALCFGISPSAAYRHRRDHISADLARSAAGAGTERGARLVAQVEAQQAAAAAHALDLLAELRRTFERVTRLFDACDRWLADPDDPGRYDLGHRAGEVLVHYTVPGPGGARLSARAPLSVLLDRALAGLGDGARVERVDTRCADPRELMLKAARRLEAELQLLARLIAQVDDARGSAAATGVTTVNVLITSPEWLATRTAILRALEPYPDAWLAVSRAIKDPSLSADSPDPEHPERSRAADPERSRRTPGAVEGCGAPWR